MNLNQRKELFFQAEELTNSGNPTAAAELLSKLYSESGDNGDFPLVYKLLYTLNKSGDYPRAIELGLKACAMPGVWDGIRQNTAWCMYFHYFKGAGQLGGADAVEHLEKMEAIFPQRQGLHPLPLSVFALLKKHPEFPPVFVIQLCRLLDPFMLNPEPCPSPNGGKDLPSAREQYTSILTRALYSSGDYSECLRLCGETLENGIQLSSGNGIWLLRRKALCHFRLEDLDQAMEMFESIIKIKQDWFLLHEAAEVAFKLKRHSQALSLAVRAAQSFGDTENKIHLWELLRQIVSREKQFDLALALLKLSASIRKFKGWKIDQNLLRELTDHNISLDTLPHFMALRGPIMDALDDMIHRDTPWLTGKIGKLLPHGKAGFILSGKSSYYFRVRDCRMSTAKLAAGLAVRFHLQASYDPQKQRESQKAVNIRPA
ncbi:MAG: hypothetical protein LHW45_08205 [Candidatus Cloacimonetes bacterium]|nr:hypothetical protein [Candidatus Cloacimonadota bacterium]MDY0367590.1 hypothetical protein [Candidatus Syntrophosphaera sp.]